MSETKRIRWHDEPKGNILGFVGMIGEWMFQIFNPDLGNGEWVLASQLPGAFRGWRYGSPEDLKVEAERWLAEFIASLGASFPDAQADEMAAVQAGED